MEQTAVEWLVQQLRKDWHLEHRDLHLVKQAKEMEAKQRNHYVELAQWIIENRRSVFEEADISTESKRGILNSLGWSSGDY